VLVLGRAFARGRESGVSLDQPAAWIAEVRDRKILRFRSFSNQREALEAVGLREATALTTGTATGIPRVPVPLDTAAGRRSSGETRPRQRTRSSWGWAQGQ
jgi:hypothetical protein